MEEAQIAAHKHSIFHKTEIMNSDVCGCFYCLAIFPNFQIERWTDEDFEGKEETAICPKCDIDSVIGSASGFPITKEFLSKMQNHWF